MTVNGETIVAQQTMTGTWVGSNIKHSAKGADFNAAWAADCTGTDCFADKGFVKAEVIKDGKAYHLLGTHTASFDTDAARNIRQIQFQQMRNFVQQDQVPIFDAVLYGG